jgi:hypothetical protein
MSALRHARSTLIAQAQIPFALEVPAINVAKIVIAHHMLPTVKATRALQLVILTQSARQTYPIAIMVFVLNVLWILNVLKAYQHVLIKIVYSVDLTQIARIHQNLHVIQLLTLVSNVLKIPTVQQALLYAAKTNACNVYRTQTVQIVPNSAIQMGCVLIIVLQTLSAQVSLAFHIASMDLVMHALQTLIAQIAQMVCILIVLTIIVQNAFMAILMKMYAHLVLHIAIQIANALMTVTLALEGVHQITHTFSMGLLQS